jgi:glycosyltransferase involved in cell wall biosynthesis
MPAASPAYRAHAHGIIANSEATAESLRRHLATREGAVIPIRVAHLGTGLTLSRHDAAPDVDNAERPYFVCIGTIEPRKNHLLLLNLWRRMAETLPPDLVPRLILVGRRGWENENILDMLDRCPALRGVVEERGRLPDRALSRLLVHARALLMPSFAEGFGLPVAEALAAGVPVIASDIPAHREAGGAVPDYLDPLDGPAWLTAIRDYADMPSARRAAQSARLARRRPPAWDSHIDALLSLAGDVAAC